MSGRDRRMQRRQMRRNRPRRHPLLRLVRVVLVVAVVFVVAEVGLDPWVLHIGGKFTPTMSWQGLGTGMSSADAGTATVTLRPGTTSDFSRACSAL
jgi:hypothetical protein